MARSNKKRLHDMTPPERLVQEMERLYPRAWDLIENFRGDPIEPWPDWCYVPIVCTYAIAASAVSMERTGRILMDGRMEHPALLAAAATWRITKGVYRFDADLADVIMAQPLDDAVPAEVLYHLPEWCVYIELPSGRETHGFLAHLEYDVNTGVPELRFVFCADEYVTWPLILKDTLDASAAALLASAAKQIPSLSVGDEDTISWVIPYLQLVLYLCATNADMPPISLPATRRGKVLPFPRPRVWDVGLRVGATLRKSREQTATHPSGASGDDRLPPRPHVRRAHYHHYWVGEGRGELAVRWIAPTLIGAQEDGPVVVRGVE